MRLLLLACFVGCLCDGSQQEPGAGAGGVHLLLLDCSVTPVLASCCCFFSAGAVEARRWSRWGACRLLHLGSAGMFPSLFGVFAWRIGKSEASLSHLPHAFPAPYIPADTRFHAPDL